MALGRALPYKAWAITYRGCLALFSGELPLYWLRHVAKRQNNARLNGAGRVVRVEVRALVGDAAGSTRRSRKRKGDESERRAGR